jgi:hypothetical protein
MQDDYPPLSEADQKKVDDDWREFWKALLTDHDGSLMADRVKRELSDYSQFMRNCALVYMHVTGGRMSKTNYDAEAVISVADEHTEELCREAIEDHLESLKKDDIVKLIDKLQQRLMEGAYVE